MQSFVHLVRHGFYDAASCRRLTAYDRLKQLKQLERLERLERLDVDGCADRRPGDLRTG
ncbi:hypothetical protein [Planomonospora venezuelensis]|uniref:Uncharacterized protein n=1 Tax=Planomonospora venezuelensis TaxID=1999 RepID=A0A841CZS0_PLAVE|nr:hypothetical protein [Planomonospora venezuelensis]MBB5963902.1 hypothetical protein [Planomonospora venezuelensis]GIN03687.1 hypothetical protein Pve01_53450 [Planomonospora venezuelensis]